MSVSHSSGSLLRIATALGGAGIVVAVALTAGAGSASADSAGAIPALTLGSVSFDPDTGLGFTLGSVSSETGVMGSMAASVETAVASADITILLVQAAPMSVDMAVNVARHISLGHGSGEYLFSPGSMGWGPSHLD